VQDTSRVGRDTTEYLLFRRQLGQRGIDLVAVTQPNIDASPEGRLVDTIVAGINQYQSEEKARRVTIAMQKKFQDGWLPTRAPLGYRNVERNGRRLIEPDPERFALIQLAFTEYRTGRYAQQRLLAFLAAKGLRDRSGKMLSRTTLNQLLSNPFYCGRMRWDGEERMGRHEPAIDRQTWERCQEVTAAHNRYLSRQRKHAFLLTGLTRCAMCENRHTQSVIARKQKQYYNCPSHARCSEPFVPKECLEEQAASRLREIELSEEFVERVVDRVRAVVARRTTYYERQVNTLHRRQNLAERKRNATEQKLVSGVLSDEAFQRLMPAITAELNEISRALEAHEAARRLDTNALRDVLVLARDIPSSYGDAPPTLKRRYLEFFFQELVVRNRKIVRVVPSEFFAAVLKARSVQKSPEWYPFLNANTTFGTLLRLLRNPLWLERQRQLGSSLPATAGA
jgi:hypothetical protein